MKNLCRTAIYLTLVVGANTIAEVPLWSPALHTTVLLGTHSSSDPGDISPGGHDFNRESGFQVQGLEPSLSLRAGEHLEGFVTGTFFTTPDDNFEGEWEEAFMKVTDLPGGLELRGGRFLTRMGFHNATHLHGWETVDAPLANSLLMGEDGLALIGGDLTWYLPTSWKTAITVGVGDRPAHQHEHGAAVAEDHDPAAEPAHDGHALGFDSFEEIQLQDRIRHLGVRSTWRIDDFNAWTGALGLAHGETAENENGLLGIAGLEYEWRENGFEGGGRRFLWRTELLALHTDLNPEEFAASKARANGLSTQLVFQANELIRPYLGFHVVERVEEIEQPQWTRFSLGCTLSPAALPQGTIRLQVNHDERADEEIQSIMLQFSLNWGGMEVR